MAHFRSQWHYLAVRARYEARLLGWYLVRCMWKGHRPKFGTWPNCIYCGRKTA
jgi:hypothetical protein